MKERQKSEILATLSKSQSKAIIFDASTIISFAMNGLFEELRKLKEIFNGKFIITWEVKREIIDRPITKKRFELEALKLRKLFNDKILELPDCLGVKENQIVERTIDILDVANNTFESHGKKIHIIDKGEAACLALSKILVGKGIDNVIAVDERTTRVLVEKPEDLKRLLKRKLHTSINSNSGNYKHFKGFKFIRSAELAYVIYKKGLMKLDGIMLLDALLYALKFKGCAISDQEIEEIKRIK